MAKILILDNNDSFTYNLVSIFEENGANIVARKSLEFDYEDAADYSAVVFSPGPGLPEDFPVMNKILEHFKEKIPILGVCLGHQAIAGFFGAELYRLENVRHGIKTEIGIINHDDKIYSDLEKPVFVGRYHSWAVREPLPECLIPSSRTSDNILMSFHHKDYNITGIQYHPESIISEQGSRIIGNWLKSL